MPKTVYTTGDIPTAANFNAFTQEANAAITGGTIDSAAITNGTLADAVITGGTIEGTPVGEATPALVGATYAIFPKTSGNGIKVDTSTPTYPWADLTSAFHTRTSGGSTPTFGSYNGTSIYSYFFSTSNLQELFVELHMPHDYVAGTEIFIHTHWSQTTVDSGGTAGVPGVIKLYWDCLYAKGHQQQAFPAAVTTVSQVQTASAIVRTHMIAEVQLSTSGAIGGNGLEPDGVLLLRCYRNPADAADTLNVAPYMHFCDLHYQSTGIGTKAKAPNFYV